MCSSFFQQTVFDLTNRSISVNVFFFFIWFQNYLTPSFLVWLEQIVFLAVIQSLADVCCFIHAPSISLVWLPTHCLNVVHCADVHLQGGNVSWLETKVAVRTIKNATAFILKRWEISIWYWSFRVSIHTSMVWWLEIHFLLHFCNNKTDQNDARNIIAWCICSSLWMNQMQVQ